MNCKVLWLVGFVLLNFNLRAVNPAMIWVEFKDKNDSPYSLNRPHEYLSSKAIERRQKQEIPIDIYDLPVSRVYIDSLLTDTSLTLFYTSRWFNGAMFRATNLEALERIKEFSFVIFTDVAKSEIINNSEKSGIQSLVNNPNQNDNIQSKAEHSVTFPYSSFNTPQGYIGYGAAELQINMLNGQSLHEKGYWGNGKTIAVLDAGYRSVDTMKAFEDLWIHNKILGYHDFVQSKSELFQGHAHGTYVFSVMGANLPGEYTGVAPAASYWLLRTEDGASEFRVEEYNWLAGAEFADSVGADIINSSLGYTQFDDEKQNYTYSDLDGATTITARAANMAFSRGLLVVNSAGNYGTQSWRYIGTPADAQGVLAVGGTDNQSNRASFSSVGPSYDGRVKPQVMAQGQGVAIVNFMGAISNANGTSFSSPLIAGMAACLWEKFPEATNAQIKSAIIRSSDRYMNPDSLFGFGIPDFSYATAILDEKLDDYEFVKLANNPLSENSAVTFYAVNDELITIEMINSNGQRVWSRHNIHVIPGFNEIKPFNDIHNLASGMYLIRVNFKNKSELVKAIKF